PLINAFGAFATRSASASPPGQLQAAASGGVFSVEGYPTAASLATAVGVGSILVNRDFAFFPLLIHEAWSVSAVGHVSHASIDLKVLLDGVLIHSRSAS